MRRNLRRLAGAVGALVGLGLVAFGVAAWTGAIALVVTTGSSMEPQFSAGDLVIVRAAGRYDVGDVVAYRNADLDRVVLHRVVSVDGGRLLTKGDNNSWVDSDRPELSEAKGQVWLHLPGFGRHVSRLFDPLVAAVVVGLATAVCLSGGSRTREELPTCIGAGS